MPNKNKQQPKFYSMFIICWLMSNSHDIRVWFAPFHSSYLLIALHETAFWSIFMTFFSTFNGWFSNIFVWSKFSAHLKRVTQQKREKKNHQKIHGVSCHCMYKMCRIKRSSTHIFSLFVYVFCYLKEWITLFPIITYQSPRKIYSTSRFLSTF